LTRYLATARGKAVVHLIAPDQWRLQQRL
jgi:hypothetical protein